MPKRSHDSPSTPQSTREGNVQRHELDAPVVIEIPDPEGKGTLQVGPAWALMFSVDGVVLLAEQSLPVDETVLINMKPDDATGERIEVRVRSVQRLVGCIHRIHALFT